MKIIFITDNFTPETNAPATRTHDHCKEWVKKGANVTVITSFPNFPEGKIHNGYKNSLLDNNNFLNGLNVCQGSVTYKAIADELNYEYVDPKKLLN